LYGHPPLQPEFPSSLSQETSYCSEKSPKTPVDMNFCPSVTATVEKAQQDPHYPWSLTIWTAPYSTQLTEPETESPIHYDPVSVGGVRSIR